MFEDKRTPGFDSQHDNIPDYALMRDSERANTISTPKTDKQIEVERRKLKDCVDALQSDDLQDCIMSYGKSRVKAILINTVLSIYNDSELCETVLEWADRNAPDAEERLLEYGDESEFVCDIYPTALNEMVLDFLSVKPTRPARLNRW